MMVVEYQGLEEKMRQENVGQGMRRYEERYAVKAKLTSLLLIGPSRRVHRGALNFTAARAAPRIARDAIAQNRPPPMKRDFQ